MTKVHVGHDCVIGNNIVIANNVDLGGFVHIENQTVIGAMTGVHQFVRIGNIAMVAAASLITKDVPPFCNVSGREKMRLRGINTLGLQRANYSKEKIRLIRQLYRDFFEIKKIKQAHNDMTDEEIRTNNYFRLTLLLILRLNRVH